MKFLRSLLVLALLLCVCGAAEARPRPVKRAGVAVKKVLKKHPLRKVVHRLRHHR